MNIEKRYIKELRAVKDSRTIKGKAICFNSESRNLGGFTEIIEPTAIDDTLIANSDIVFLYNHDENKGVLARSKNGVGTLQIEIKEDGLYFEFEAPNTSIGNDTYESIKRGDLDSCSFAFTVRKEDQVLEKRDNGVYLRRIKKFNSINDLSIVVNPAYEKTETSVRNVQKDIEEIEENERKEAEKQKEIELDNYYKELEKEVAELKK